MTMKDFLEQLDHLPTTRIRVLVTIGLIAATGVYYFLHACGARDPVTQICVGWEPSLNWFIFLAALAGVDVTQYFAKSFTAVKHAEIVANAQTNNVVDEEDVEDDENVISTSDITELRVAIESKG